MLVPRALHVDPRVDVVVNRRAKKLVHEGRILNALRSAVATATSSATLHETRSLGDLEAVVATIAARGTDTVILAGGDGSYMAGTTALHHAFGAKLPQLAFAPGGTVSTVARNWGLRGDEASYARRLVLQSVSGTAATSTHPTLCVRDDRGGDRVGFIFGAGLIARFFDAYYAAEAQGYAGAALLVARIFAGTFTRGELATRVLTPSACRLEVDGAQQASPVWNLIAASVVGDLGLHMRLLYRAAERSDRFHVVASSLPARGLSPQVWRVLAGRRLAGEGHVDTLASRVTLEGAGHYVLDGECIEAGRVTVTPGPVLSYVSATDAPG